MKIFQKRNWQFCTVALEMIKTPFVFKYFSKRIILSTLAKYNISSIYISVVSQADENKTILRQRLLVRKRVIEVIGCFSSQYKRTGGEGDKKNLYDFSDVFQ